MSYNFPLGDLITKIRNGYRADLKEIQHMDSKFCRVIVGVLLREGIIANYYSSPRTLHLELKYIHNEPAVRELTILSRPGRRQYLSLQELWDLEGNLGLIILSTPKGVLTDIEARQQHVGGEALCRLI
jgi:small subunit ribosomal protein S8